MLMSLLEKCKTLSRVDLLLFIYSAVDVIPTSTAHEVIVQRSQNIEFSLVLNYVGLKMSSCLL